MLPSETICIIRTDRISASQQQSTALLPACPERAGNTGFTLIEILIVMGIIGVLAVIANSGFTAFKDKAREARAAAEIRAIEKDINAYALDKSAYPANYDALVATLGRGDLLDPWGRRYEYKTFVATQMRYFGGGPESELNADFDLFSKGKDGNSDPSLADLTSDDDIIRANDGSFVGIVKLYTN